MRNRRNALGTELPQALEGSVEALLLDFPWAQREVERARIGKAQAADLGSRGEISRAVAAELARLAKLANSFVAIFRRTRSRLYRNRFLQVMFPGKPGNITQKKLRNLETQGANVCANLADLKAC